MPGPMKMITVTPDEFDIFWYDWSINSDTLSKMKQYQRVS